VKLDRIEFYPLDEATTMMNLYKSGRIDATYNHTIPAPWFDEISQYKDEYLPDAGERERVLCDQCQEAAYGQSKGRGGFCAGDRSR
jgi:hypothetical protein